MKKLLIPLSIVLISATTSFAGGTVNQFSLSNGLKVIHKEITKNPLVTVQLFLHGGTVNETPSQAGLAHFTQVLLMQGTGKRNAEQLAQEIEDIGASITSEIEHDYSSLGISLMDTHVEKAMDILADIAFNPTFPEPEIEKERRNILAAIRSRQDQIHYVANDLFNQAFYGDYPYSWPDVGKAETVSKINRKDLADWHAKYYVTDNMLMVIAGNISLDKAKALAEKYFNGCPKGVSAGTGPNPEMPAAKNVSRPTKKFKQAYLMIGFPAPDLKQRDFPVLKIVNAMLGSRMSGRLFVELREKLSLAYEVNSYYPTREHLSRFVGYLGLEKKNLALANKRMTEIFDELKTTPVPDKELQETKNFIRGVYLLDHQTIGRQAWYLGWWTIMGRGYQYDEQYLNDLMAVTPADITAAANKYFTDRRVQVEIIPQ